MTARCEPPAEHRAMRWHWLQLGSLPPVVAEWDNDDFPGIPWWHQGDWFSAERVADMGWRYLAPCVPPEVGG